MYYTRIEPNIGVKMRLLLGIKLDAKWIQVGAQIAAAISAYSHYIAAESAWPKPKEQRAAFVRGLSNVCGVLELLQTPFIGFRSKAKSERLEKHLQELRTELTESIKALHDLRGRPRAVALKQLAFDAALLLYLLRTGHKVPKHSEHHAFARLMLQDAGIKTPGPGLADVCKDQLVRMKRKGIFGEKKSQLKRLLPPPII